MITRPCSCSMLKDRYSSARVALAGTDFCEARPGLGAAASDSSCRTEVELEHATSKKLSSQGLRVFIIGFLLSSILSVWFDRYCFNVRVWRKGENFYCAVVGGGLVRGTQSKRTRNLS